MGFLSGNMNFLNIYMFMAAAILLLAVGMKGNVPQNKQYIIWSCLIMFVVYGLRDTWTVILNIYGRSDGDAPHGIPSRY